MTRTRRTLAAALLALALSLPGWQALAGGHAGHHSHRYCSSCSRDSHGRIKRSEGAKHKFLKSKGLTHVPKGYEVDHVVPLSKSGKDEPSNMQLLPHEQHEAKTRNDLR